MMGKHTPGPWKIGRLGTVVADSPEGLSMNGATGADNVKYYGGNLIGESIDRSNSHLIAAAPDLLEALERLVASSQCSNGCDPDDMSCDSNFARAAIAKAKG